VWRALTPQTIHATTNGLDEGSQLREGANAGQPLRTVRTYHGTRVPWYCVPFFVMYQWYIYLYGHTYVRTRIQTTSSPKRLEIQALRCNGETRGRCQHRRQHGILRFQLDSEVCRADLHHNPRKMCRAMRVPRVVVLARHFARLGSRQRVRTYVLYCYVTVPCYQARTRVHITLSRKRLETQALRCNGETREHCQHRRNHSMLRFQIDSDYATMVRTRVRTMVPMVRTRTYIVT
jgi:hypothetical protein